MKKKIIKEGNKSLEDKTEKELKVKNDKNFMFFPWKKIFERLWTILYYVALPLF